jgi:hypothetical protein
MERESREGPEKGSDRAALAFAALFPTLFTWLYFVRLAGTPWALPVYAVGKTIQFAFPLVWVLWIRRERPGIAPARGRGLGWALVSGVAMVAFAVLAWRLWLSSSPALAQAPAVVTARLASFGVRTAPAFLLLAVFYSVFHSGLEEYYWRWFLFGRLRRRLPFAGAAALASLAFALHHVLVIGQLLGGIGPVALLASASVAVAGLLWAALYERSGSVAGPWISHALADAALMWIGFKLWV